jgi:dephospho-CoA kinase
MILVGLTGGIGAGKSTVSALLAGRGAVVIDADAITRALQEPGQPVLAAIVDRFGSGVLTPDGCLDRAGLAEIVFGDPDALRDLNAIVHPAVGAEIARRIAAEQDSGRIVVLDVPLLVETGRDGLSGIVVVDVPTDTAVERLVVHRGMSEDDARARVAVQASRDERLAKADVVIDNSSTREALEKRVAEVWAWMQQLPDADRPREPRGSVPPPR